MFYEVPAPAVAVTAPPVVAGAIRAGPDAPGEAATELSVLTYNVRGLPWPVALHRGAALREIGRRLADMREAGVQPDVVLIQEGFRREVADLVRESGYRYWVRGPERGDAPGKLTGGGLHVLSDTPIEDVRTITYSACAGFDCLAAKGAMLVRIQPTGALQPIEVLNTHLNARHASKAAAAEAQAAHNRQTDQLNAFVEAARDPELPLLVGGDFNVKHAPERYYHAALARPYMVVSEFCSQPGSGCGPGAADAAVAEPWLASQDLQAFAADPGVRIQPISTARLFTAPDPKARLSDHDGYLVRYRLSWNWSIPTIVANPGPGVRVKPQLGKFGLKVSWKPGG
jgi:endonuclease/exonuclease/phosphatase family metal-dependent hydrolase